MDICLQSSGSYCANPNIAILCQSWVNICGLYNLVFELVAINFSVTTERDRAHGLLTELVSSGGFQGRFPEGVLVNLDSSPYVELISQILGALDFSTRADEKLAKDTGYTEVDIWEFDDALTAYYKGIKELNSKLVSGTAVYDRDKLESQYNLVWV